MCWASWCPPPGTQRCWCVARGVGYLLQIYFDFLATATWLSAWRMFGFTFPEFRLSVSCPLRDGILAALASDARAVVPGTMSISWAAAAPRQMDPQCCRRVWLLTGLWHGAAWNFVLWGGYFGLLLPIERLWLENGWPVRPLPVQHALLLLLVTLGFVLFRAESLQACGRDAPGRSAARRCGTRTRCMPCAVLRRAPP